MTLSKREKYIGIGVGSLIALWVLYSLVVSFYFDPRSELVAQQTITKNKLSDLDVLFHRRDNLQHIWTDMQKGGLKSDASAADSQAQHAMVDWFNGSGVYLSGLKSDLHVAEEGKFQVVKYHVEGYGHMRQVAMLLWATETATIPVRVDELAVKPRGREGIDDLSIELSVSTLSSIPDADKTVRPAVSSTVQEQP